MDNTSNGTKLDPILGNQWLTPKEFSRILSCTPAHVRFLVDDYTINEFGLPTFIHRIGKRRMRYIFTPTSMLR